MVRGRRQWAGRVLAVGRLRLPFLAIQGMARHGLATGIYHATIAKGAVGRCRVERAEQDLTSLAENKIQMGFRC
jgi:hypothetical protein